MCIYTYIYICVCVCVYIYIYIYLNGYPGGVLYTQYRSTGCSTQTQLLRQHDVVSDWLKSGKRTGAFWKGGPSASVIRQKNQVIRRTGLFRKRITKCIFSGSHFHYSHPLFQLRNDRLDGPTKDGTPTPSAPLSSHLRPPSHPLS